MIKPSEQKGVIVGMSGGIDSSVSLILLKKMGYKPIGVSLKYDIWKDPSNLCKENVCCSKESLEIARSVCKAQGVEHKVIDVREEFNKEVIAYFSDELKKKRTPSPCLICNKNLKFSKLIEIADKLKIEFVATGHYAKKIKNTDGSFDLGKAKDLKKDQTYSLSMLSQNQLKRVIFPLSDLTKDEVQDLSKKYKISEHFEKNKQSQDFCFVSGKSINQYLEKVLGIELGDIVDENDFKLSKHKGLHFYTIGQRKNICLPGGPYYVVAKDKKSNKLVVSKEIEDFKSKEIELSNVNFINKVPKGNSLVLIKTRSSQDLRKAKITFNKNKVSLILDEPELTCPGQFAVIYERKTCLGSGVIN